MKDFTEKAFEEAIRTASDEEFDAFKKNIVGNENRIVDTVRIKLMLEGKGDESNKMAEQIVKAGLAETFAAFVGSLMQICFSVGYGAGRESMMNK